MGTKATKTQASLRDRGTNILPGNLALPPMNLLIPGLEEGTTRFVEVKKGANRNQHGR
jgi:hypothetical protein